MLDELESSDTEDNDASLPDQDAADGEVGGSPAVLGTGAACAAAAGLTVPLQDGDAQVSERRSGSPHPFFNPKRPHREVSSLSEGAGVEEGGKRQFKPLSPQV